MTQLLMPKMIPQYKKTLIRICQSVMISLVQCLMLNNRTHLEFFTQIWVPVMKVLWYAPPFGFRSSSV